MTKYFILLAGDGEVGAFDEMSPEEQGAVMGRFEQFDEACRQRDGVEIEIESAEALETGETATTLRTRGGEMTITDGPYAEATEQIGGYYLVTAPDLDTVIDLCRKLPAYDIEIRPAIDMG